MHYKVFVNGQNLPVHEARVSKHPFNQVWQGKQRPINQTEIAYFVTFDFSGIAKLEIEVSGATVTEVEIRPFEYELHPVRNGQRLEVEVTRVGQFIVEVNGRHQALHVFANSSLHYRHTENDIYFGPGEHCPGVIMPRTGQTVYIDEKAVVYGAIFVYKADNVRITGRGILDASRLLRGEENSPATEGYEMAESFTRCGLPSRDKKYTSALVAYDCENLIIDGIIIRDAMLWTVIVRNHCRKVLIDNIKIIGQWRYNSDGIDICASENVVVKNSFIRSFDDCVVARGAYLERENTELCHLTVENCVMWCDWGKSIEVWAGHLPEAIHSITFRNNYLIHLSGLALDITTWFGSDRTRIADILFQDIYINTDETYESMRIQNHDDEHYVSELGFVPQLLRIDCDRLGEFVGNQTTGAMGEASCYTLEYDHIVLENIRCRGKDTALPIVIDAQRNPVEINHVVLRGVDTDHIVLRGKIKNFSLE